MISHAHSFHFGCLITRRFKIITQKPKRAANTYSTQSSYHFEKRELLILKGGIAGNNEFAISNLCANFEL